MINKRTVFLLGAGANVPYGFSTGGELLHKLRGVDPQELMGNAGRQITEAEAAAFRAAVLDNMLPSIDPMLEHRADLVRVGKRAMATLLYKDEANAGPRSFDEDWMAFIFERMANDAPSMSAFAQNAVSFVTFNYDRYLEHRFIRGLVARYRVTGREAWDAVKQMFVHLYGSLGRLPDQAPQGLNDGTIVPLGAAESPGVYTLGVALPIAENAIRIVHDAAPLPPEFDEAMRRFQTAEQVLFLGFGFGRQNVERLRTGQIPASALVACTTFNMTPAEVTDMVIPAFPNHPLSDLRRAGTTGVSSIRLFLRERISWLR